jgi:hypothetical protein
MRTGIVAVVAFLTAPGNPVLAQQVSPGGVIPCHKPDRARPSLPRVSVIPPVRCRSPLPIRRRSNRRGPRAGQSDFPEPLEAIRREGRVPHRRGDRAVAEMVLDRPRIVSVFD